MKINQKQKLAMNLNLIALFSLGAFFSFLSYLATTLEDIKLFQGLGMTYIILKVFYGI